MASSSSIISLIVVLLAAYSYSVPIVSNVQNTTFATQVGNITSDLRYEDLVLFVRNQQNPPTYQEKRVKNVVSLSSEEDDSDETTQSTNQITSRDFEDSSVPSSSETNMKREVDTEVNESQDETGAKRSVTENSSSTEINTRRGIEVESFETSTIVDETSTVDDTSVPPSSQIKNVKRSSGDSWLSDESDDVKNVKRSSGDSWLADDSDDVKNVKRSSGDSWLSDESDDVKNVKRSSGDSWLSGETNDEVRKRSVEVSTDTDETTTVEETSVPSTSQVTDIKRGMGQSSSLTDEAKEEFNKRAIGASNEMTNAKRDAKQSSSFPEEQTEESNKRAVATVESVEAGESSTVVVVKIQPESTTDNEVSSSTVEYDQTTEVMGGEFNSTSEYETTVVPVEESTSSSPVPTGSTSKILAIIPGTVSRSQVVVQPPEQIQLSQGKNQSIVEEKKRNY